MKLTTSLGVVGIVLGGLTTTGKEAHGADIGTAFTYQGFLEKPAGTPLTDTCDFRFGLWDAPAMGIQVDDEPPRINTTDGVALAVIQGLYRMVNEKDCEIENLKEDDAEIRARLARVEAILSAFTSNKE